MRVFFNNNLSINGKLLLLNSIFSVEIDNKQDQELAQTLSLTLFVCVENR